MTRPPKRLDTLCELCNGTGWLHGAQEWTAARMRKGTPYKSVRCACAAHAKALKGEK